MSALASVVSSPITDTVDRSSANLKVLHHDCGCRKHVCLSKGKDSKPCTRSCQGCAESLFIDPCRRHSNVRGYVRDRNVVNVEYFC